MALGSLLARMTRTDRWLVLLLMLAAFASLWFVLGRSVGRSLLVYAGDTLAFTAPLDQDRQIELHGPLGDTLIEVVAGKVRVISSPCSRKICIGMGAIQRSGDLLACVPNRVVIRIEGEGGEYDLLSR